MKKIIIGIIIGVIWAIASISGITCLVIGNIAGSNIISSFNETLLIIGFIGLGICIGGIIVLIAIIMAVTGYESPY